ncbi:DNA polymerase alpha catalytic subunit [Neodiprion lecontei]|uniref:DNA polymerase n=1 Tax=Neodiprion lecontei TaxID=441921 RepID=A0ABM3G683_NEOLC|nr:DNA polymerase alpha catalytic subunit [Neodiprion lecontei]
MDEPASLQTGRSRRQKIDKKGRYSALEKLKQLKGSKNKYHVDELANVYEEVDESEYSKKVQERQIDDWIVDDDGNGYVEDGREIFDDDLDSESIQQASQTKESGPRKKKSNSNKGKGNIRNMLVGMPSKKETQVKLDDDDILNDLMAELKSGKQDVQPKKTREPNKFLVRPHTKLRTNEKITLPPKLQKPLLNVESASQQIDDNSEDEQLFDIATRSEKSMKKETDLKTTSQFCPSSVSISQAIDDDSDIETQNYSCRSSEAPFRTLEKAKPSHTNHIVDSMEEDINHYTDDLSSFDFEDSNQALTDTSKTTKALQPELKGKTVKPSVTNEDMLSDLWDDDFGEQITEMEISVDNSNLPLHVNETGEKIFRFYWWDAFEDPYKQPGVVYLFGKVYIETAKAYVSCCIAVKNIDRRIYLLPREHVKPTDTAEESETKAISMMDVYKEFNEYANKNGIKSFRSCTVTKSYAFEKKGVPKTSEYLEVKYPAKDPAIASNYSGPTIEQVFGTSVNALELLLIERKIKGPCWLDVKCPLPTNSPVSWCKVEVNCLKAENISVSISKYSTPPPPLIVATLNVRISFNTKSQQNEIAMIGVLLHNKYHIDQPSPKPPFVQHFCLITRPEDAGWVMYSKESLIRRTQTELIHCDKERNLLEELLNRLQKADPDLLVGCDCGFQFDVLMHRMFNLRIPNWSRVGRLKRTLPPMYKGKVLIGQVLSGRLLCDIQTSAKELNLKVRSYDLQSLCTNVLKGKEKDCREIKPEDTAKYYANIEKLVELVRLTMLDASRIIMIMFELNVMPLALQITCIAGNILSRTLTAGRAERNEYLLLHAFNDRGYITPDKRNTKADKNNIEKDESNSRKKKAAYAGGLVLEPKKGFYDTLILLMDFNSLYPSIIQEYNICFTTVPGAAYSDSTELCIPETCLEPGVIPTEIRKLVESRVQVKNLMKASNISPELRMQYNIRQLALKLTANSMYGCLGATHCRFYAKGLAALVTAKGREILINTKDLVERLNYQVIYGDTDSIMINTNVLDYEQVFAIGKQIKQEVNKLYKKVELDIDGVFKYLLLLQKKKYAAVTMTKLPNGQIETTQEHKGLDIVRRDWCQLACEVGRNVLDQLLCEQPFDARLENIFEILRVVSKSLKEGNVPLSSLVITKQLSKNPSDYPDRKQAHVSVALRLNEKGGRMWKAGDTVPYIICGDGTDKSATERAYHVDELKNSETLKIDVNYYLLSQLFPVIMRICDPIDGIDDVLLSEHLGLEGIYKPKQHFEHEEALPLLDDDKFKYCDHLKFTCQNEMCRTEITMDGAFTNTPTGLTPVLSKCSNTDCSMAPWQYLPTIQNRLQLAIRAAIDQYYEGWMECEDPACFNKTRRVPQQIFGIHPVCDLCQKCVMYRIYTETQLYNQISYYHHILDINKPTYKHLGSQLSTDVRNAYNILREFVEKQLRSSAYSIVNLTQLFSYLDSNWTKQKGMAGPRFYIEVSQLRR